MAAVRQAAGLALPQVLEKTNNLFYLKNHFYSQKFIWQSDKMFHGCPIFNNLFCEFIILISGERGHGERSGAEGESGSIAEERVELLCNDTMLDPNMDLRYGDTIIIIVCQVSSFHD